MRNKAVMAVVLGVLALAGRASATDEPQVDKKVQHPKPTRPEAGAEAGAPAGGPLPEGATWAQPPTQHGGDTSRRLGVASAAPRPAAAAATVSDYRALATAEGEARLLVAGAERVVKPGTVLGTDVVKSVAPGQVVVLRPARPEAGGEALVIITFDAQGRGRERVVWTKDPTAQAPREVRPR
jgi:hypothetical protein